MGPAVYLAGNTDRLPTNVPEHKHLARLSRRSSAAYTNRYVLAFQTDIFEPEPALDLGVSQHFGVRARALNVGVSQLYFTHH